MKASAGFTRAQRERAARLASRVAGEESGLRRKGHGWRRGERDEQLLQFATLHGMILLRQAAKWFYGGNEDLAFRRVVKMEQAGLVNRDSGVAEWAGTVVTPTTAGQKVGLLELPGPFERLAQRALSVPDNLLHAALVADQVLVQQSKGYRVLTERQIRLLDKHDDAAEVRAFLESQGVRFSSSEMEAGVRPGVVFRQRRTGEGPDDVVVERYSTFLAAPVPSPKQPLNTREPESVRFPDFVYISPTTGELVAMEVEIATKASDRLQAIIAGYSRAVAQPVSDGRGGFEARAERDEHGREHWTPVMRRHQFRQVRWLCVEETANLLRGRFDPKLYRYRTDGLIPSAMPMTYRKDDGRGGTQLRVDWHNQSAALPMQVHLVEADDVGVQYRLDQREVSPHYRCSYKRWKVWRQVWKADVPAEKRGTIRFIRWLQGQSPHGEFTNHEWCILTEQKLANAAPPRS